MHAYATGMAAVDDGNIDDAQTRADLLDEMIWVFTIQPPNASDPFYSKTRLDLLSVFSLELQGAIASRAGRHERAMELLNEALTMEERLAYAEPPDYARPVLESLGEALLRAAKWDETREAYEQVLRK